MQSTAGQTVSMTVKLGISLSDETHHAAVAAAKAEGLALSAFIDRVLARELFRCGIDDHNEMVRQAGLAEPDLLRVKVAQRQRAIGEWKVAGRSVEGRAG